MIDVEDIARALSNTCRFAGHVKNYYSVAEHAVLVSRLVPPELAYPALHHDSHEAYVGDIPTPLKHLLGRPYRRAVRRVDRAVSEALSVDLSLLHCLEVRAADAFALRIEAARLKPSHGLGEHWGHCRTPQCAVRPQDLECLPPELAEEMFLWRHYELRAEWS